MTAQQLIQMARARSVVEDDTLRLIESDPAILAWLDQWLPSRAAGTLAMVQGVIPADIRARLGEENAERMKATLPYLIGLYTRGFNAQS